MLQQRFVFVHGFPHAFLIRKGQTLAFGKKVKKRAHGKSLRDSGINVIIGVGDRAVHNSWKDAEADGFAMHDIEEAVKKADIVHILLQDPAQPAVYYSSIHAHLRPGQTLIFAHGFAILYGTIKPPQATCARYGKFKNSIRFRSLYLGRSCFSGLFFAASCAGGALPSGALPCMLPFRRKSSGRNKCKGTQCKK